MAHPKDSDYPLPSSQATTAVMKANKRSNTKLEIAVRGKLHNLGYRFRKDFPVPLGSRKCRPDVVFTRKKIAIFIDGCFWHFCPMHGHIPKSNIDYWQKKFKRNTERDKSDTAALEEAGWTVIRVWEHSPIDEIIKTITSEIHKNINLKTDSKKQ